VLGEKGRGIAKASYVTREPQGLSGAEDQRGQACAAPPEEEGDDRAKWQLKDQMRRVVERGDRGKFKARGGIYTWGRL